LDFGGQAIGNLDALPPVRRHKITDPMSGLFLVRLDRIDLDALAPKGYKILLEVLAKGRLKTVEEVGFAFGTRAEGESKLGAAVILQYLTHLAALAFHHPDNRRAASFAVVGASGVGVNLGILWYLHGQLALHDLVAVPIAVEVSILWNFLWNDLITFRDRRHDHVLQRMAKFNAVSLIAMGLNVTTYALLQRGFGLHYLLAEALAIVVAFSANYLGNLRWTYGGEDRFRLRGALRRRKDDPSEP